MTRNDAKDDVNEEENSRLNTSSNGERDTQSSGSTDWSNVSTTRRNALRTIGSGSLAGIGVAATSGAVQASFSLDFTIYTGETMDSVADSFGYDTFGPADWVKDYYNSYWDNVSNISGTDGTVSTDIVPDSNFDDSSCANFLSDFNNWLSGRSDKSIDTNVLLTNVSSVDCGGIAYAACSQDDGNDAAAVFASADMYETYNYGVSSTYEFDSDGDGTWGTEDDGYYKLSTSFMEGGHNLGFGHKHGNSKDSSPPEFYPMLGGYADSSGSSCCGQDNWCGDPLPCIDIYDNNCIVDYRLADCTQSAGAYPGYPYCDNDGKDSCPNSLGKEIDENRLTFPKPIPHSEEDLSGSRSMEDAKKRQEERGKFASEIIIPKL